MDYQEAKISFMRRTIAKGCSNATIITYENFFVTVEKWLKKEEVTDVDKITPDMCRNYLVLCRNRLASITTLGYYTRLNTFFKYLVDNEMLAINPLAKVDKPKVAKKEIPTFTSLEVNQMMQAYDLDTFLGRRNYTILALLLSTGMRRNEYLNLTLNDVDLKTGLIKVLGKGNKERYCPISKSLKTILNRYMAARREYLGGYGCKYVFISRYKDKMTISASNELFKSLRKRLGLSGKRFSAHVWRHTYATAFLLNGGNIFTLQKLLGHEDIETTRVYVNLTQGNIKNQQQNFNPLDNHNWQYQ